MARKSKPRRALDELKQSLLIAETETATEPFNFTCNRRMSRAARSILQHAMEAWRRKTSRSSQYDDDITNVWDLLEASLDTQNSNASQCLLVPDRDALRVQEQSSQRIPAIAVRTGVVPGESRNVKRTHWYRCGMCSKLFVTRYYLDVHWETHHHYAGGDVCPGTQWCRFLSEQACHNQALVEEPYYGRGSEGLRHDRTAMRRFHTRMAHAVPCDDTHMVHTRSTCHEQLQTCFGDSDLSTYLQHALCDRISCRSRLHQLWSHTAAGAMDWEDHWQYYTRHPSHGWFAVLVVALLCLIYGVYWWQYSHRRRQLHTAGTRLLHVHVPRKTGLFSSPHKKKLS
jgi:hypothetical protein